jgi:hypothetical protein
LIFKGLTARRLYKSFGVKGLKRRDWFQIICYNQKRYAVTQKLYKNYEIWQPSGIINMRHNCLTVGWSYGSQSPVSNSTGGDAHVSVDDLKKASTEQCRNKDLFFSFRTSLQQTCILVIACPVAAARCLFQSVSSNTDASFNQSKPLSKLQNRHGPLLRLRLRLRLLIFFKGGLLLNFNKIIKYQLLIIEVEQRE